MAHVVLANSRRPHLSVYFCNNWLPQNLFIVLVLLCFKLAALIGM